MANVTYTVQNKNGSYDGDMVLKQYSSVSIDTGDTVTTDQPCRGLFIYCQGNFVLNGTINMQGRGAYANPTTSGGSDSNAVGTNGLRLGLRTASGTDSLTNDGTEFNGAGTVLELNGDEARKMLEPAIAKFTDDTFGKGTYDKIWSL